MGKPAFIVHHCTDDLTLQHTINHFQNTTTPPDKRASSTFVIDRDGTPYQFVSSQNTPWTNGYVCNPRTDLPALTAAIRQAENGGFSLNDWCITYEFVATPDEPPTDAQYDAAIGLSRYFCATYGIPPDRSHQLRHADIDSCTRDYCPGPRFQLDRIITALGGDPAHLG